MKVKELSREQLIELKQAYLSGLVNEGLFAEVMGVDYDEPSMEDYANADELVSDDFTFMYYEGMDFCEEDFWCEIEG